MNYNICSIRDAFIALDDLKEEETDLTVQYAKQLKKWAFQNGYDVPLKDLIEVIDQSYNDLHSLKDLYSSLDLSAYKKNESLSEGNTYNIRDKDDMVKAKEFLKDSEERDNTVLQVIDADADSVTDLKNPEAYIGKLLLQCNSCKATRFMDIDKLQPEEDNEDIYNVEDECPHCHSVGNGYTLIGQVGKRDDKEDDEVSADNDKKVNNDEPEFDNNIENDSADNSSTDDTDSTDLPSEDDVDVDAQIDSLLSDEPETDFNETNAEDDTLDMDNGKLGDVIDRDDINPDIVDSEDDDKLYDKYAKDNDEDDEDDEEESKKKKEKSESVSEEFGEENLFEFVQPEEEDIEWDGNISQFIRELILNPDNVTITNYIDGEAEEIDAENIPEQYDIEKLQKFNTSDRYMHVTVGEEPTNYTVKEVFSHYLEDEENSAQIILNSVDNEDSIDIENVKELLDKYADKYLYQISVKTLNLYSDDAQIEKINLDDIDDEESLTEGIISANSRLKPSKINDVNSEEYFISESIKYGEDLDLVYNSYVSGNKVLENKFKEITGYKTELDNFLEKYNIDLNGYNEYLQEKQKEENDLEGYRLFESVSDRKQLSTALTKLKESNINYMIKRSRDKQHRYDIFVEEDAQLVPSRPRPVKDLVTRTVNNDLNVNSLSLAEIKVINRIVQVTEYIADAIYDTYQIEVNKNLIAADILQDLKLVGGAISPKDLRNPGKEVTELLYNVFMQNTPKKIALNVAIDQLYNDQIFGKEAIYSMIGSDKFKQVALSGSVPYLPASSLRGLLESDKEDDIDSEDGCDCDCHGDDCDCHGDDCQCPKCKEKNKNKEDDDKLQTLFDEIAFDDAVNNFFMENYNRAVHYATMTGKLLDEGIIIIEGIVETLDKDMAVTFKLTPQLSEAKDGKVHYTVTNNISKESFTF